MVESRYEESMRSPRLGPAVFILCGTRHDGYEFPLATAFAVVSSTNSILLTCAHVLAREKVDSAGVKLTRLCNQPLFICDSINKTSADFVNRIPVSVIAYYLRGDVAILQSFIPLPSTLPFIKICPIDSLPSARNEDLVKVYKADIQVFNETTEMMVLEASATLFNKVVAVSNTHMLIPSANMPGCSGGPVVNIKGELVGIQITVQRYTAPLPESEEDEMEIDKELLESLNDAISSVSMPTTTYSAATIPQAVINNLADILARR